MLDHLAMWTRPDAIWSQEAAQLIDRLQAAQIDILMPYVSRRSANIDNNRAPIAASYEERLQALVGEAHRFCWMNTSR